MNTTIEALQALYVALGGDLTDAYEDIANGVAVSEYAVIPDIINAIAELKASEAEASSDNTAETTELGGN